ncbi:MAG: TonB family protein [Paludibacteraceae bacterium]|nr:TonB family protein [Paludibacteraceae bacterium]
MSTSSIILQSDSSLSNVNHAPLPFISVKSESEEEKRSVRMTELTVTAEVNGRIVTTTYDMIFESNSSRTLEGELEFPLGDGQTVSGYALDVDGKMREGVVVDKAKARKTFENIVRRGIDPGLVEKTKGNNFKTRVYPLTKGHPRHVRITYNQEIRVSEGKQTYSLPFYSNELLDKFSLNVKVLKQKAQPIVKSSFHNFKTSDANAYDLISLEEEKVVLKDFLSIEVPIQEENSLLTTNDKEYLYFYLMPNLSFEKVSKEKPKSIAVVFDASGSAENRNIERELSLLQNYMKMADGADIRLVIFNNKIMLDQKLPHAKYAEVEKLIKKYPLDGGTQMGLLDFASFKEDEILLFSDGLSNFGAKEAPVPTIPLYAINSSVVADYANLRRLTGAQGDYLNLNEMTDMEVLEHLSSRYPRLLSVECKGADPKDIFPQNGTIVDENFAVFGKTVADNSKIILNILNPNGEKEAYTYEVKSFGTNTPELDKIWAQKKLASLELNSKVNQAEIKKLALKYGLVSDYTSLIVLENVLDYILYEIEPPADLREEYERLREEYEQLLRLPLSESIADDWGEERLEESPESPVPPAPVPMMVENDEAREIAVAEDSRNMTRDILDVEDDETSVAEGRADDDEDEQMIFSRVEKRAEFPGGMSALRNYLETHIRYPQSALEISLQGRVIVRFCVEEDGRVTHAEVVRGVDPLLDEETLRVVRGMPNWIPAENGGKVVRSWVNLPVLFRLTGNDSSESGTNMTSNSVNESRPTIPATQIKGRNVFRLPTSHFTDARKNAPEYLKEIKRVSKEKAYAKYLQMKKEHKEVIFFLDMADYFRSIGEKEIALRILSNIAELKLEDSEVIRSLGGKLMEYGEYELAVETYKDVVNMREEEPQSYRDLALAYEAVGNYEEAYSLMDTVTNGKWERFSEIKEVSADELAELAVQHPNSRSSKELENNKDFGYDLRVVISWNTDNCDMDLWVVDPTDDACGYKNHNTNIGGHITHDFTRGYGPEAFTLKKAIPGTYKIYVNYYGTTSQRMLQPVIVRVTTYRDYGRKNQTCTEKMVMLDAIKGWTELDSVEVK